MIDELILLSGNDIPFPQGQLMIHQPTLKEIGLIGERTFFAGCQIINVSKDVIEIEDKVGLDNINNFEILMSIMKDSSGEMSNVQQNFLMVLALIFPKYNVDIQDDSLVFTNIETNEIGYLNSQNFQEFKNIIFESYCLNNFFGKEEEDDDSWMGETAKRIAKKLKERQKKLRDLKGNTENNGKIAVFSRYISILSVGEHKDMNDFFNYTIFQLLDEFQRYELKMNFDFYVQAKMAGAKDLEDVDDWMKDLHP